MQTDILKKNTRIYIWFLTLKMKIKSYCKNTMTFEMELRTKCGYEKDYMKIKFNSDDDLPLNKPLIFHNMAITIRSVFEEDGKLYPQVFLDDTLYELNV